jgi:hypothetical protein
MAPGTRTCPGPALAGFAPALGRARHTGVPGWAGEARPPTLALPFCSIPRMLLTLAGLQVGYATWIVCEERGRGSGEEVSVQLRGARV